MKKNSLAIFLALVLSIGLFVEAAAAADTPEDRVAAYHQAILDGDIEAAKGMLGEDLILYEDGVAENSKEKYAEGHLKADIAFSEKAKRKLLSQRSWVAGETATVASVYDLKTSYKGKSYHLNSAETVTLKMRDGDWVIVHVHWSNHRIGK